MNVLTWLNWLIGLFQKRHLQNVQNPSVELYVEPPVANSSQNWLKYLSLPYRTQWAGAFDEDNCATRAAIECLEAIFNYYLMNNLFPPATTDFLKKNFCNDQGFVKLSIRYNSKLNNTTINGASVDTVWNNFAQFGIIPEKMYPDPVGNFTWNQYYSDVPADVLAFGKQTLNLFKINWQTIWNGRWQAPDISVLKQSLISSPVYFAGGIGRVLADGIERWNGVKTYQHARLIYAEDNFQEVLDSYVNPGYLHKLEWSYPIPCAIKCGIKIIT